MNFTRKEKQAVIAVLTSIMKADGVVEQHEQDFMDHIYGELEVDIDDVQGARGLDIQECRQVIHDLTAEKKDYIDKCFLQMAGVDGRVDLRELRVLHELIMS